MSVKVYVSESCSACEEIKADLAKFVEKGEVEIISIDTETGFEEFAKEVLDKSSTGEAGIPYACDGGEKCQILRGANKLAIRCSNGKIIGATPEEVES